MRTPRFHLAAILAAILAALLCLAAPAQEGAPGPLPVGGADTGRSRRQARVEIDEETRTLIVTTDPATNEQIRAVLEALDQPVPQALIKVLFLEVTHNDDTDIGLDASHDRTDPDDGDRRAFQSILGAAGGNTGGIVTILQNDLDVTLHALAEVGKLNVLSRPSILARNHEEATITIGQEVPFIRNSRVTTDGQTINTVEYEDIGIILTVTPHMTRDHLIELDVAPEISTLTAETVAISDTVNAPVFAKRSAQTHVIVPSGKTVVIGGLMEDQATETVTKVPLLGDIPGLGRLFRRTVTSKNKTELLIFLTPIRIDSGEHLERVSAAEHDNAPLVRRETDPATVERFLAPPPPAAPATPAADADASAPPR